MRVVFVDDALTGSNPSSQSLFLALKGLAEENIEIEFWGNSLDSDWLTKIPHRKIPSVRVPVVGSFVNWFLRNLLGGVYFFTDERRSETVYLSTGGHFYFADIAWFHFYNRAWNDIQNRGVVRGPESPLRQLLMQWGRFEDWVILNSPFLKKVLPVSDAIGDELRQDHPRLDVLTLPNAVDLQRFDVSKKKRSLEFRREFGYKEELIMLFVSQGHYTRKGLWLAIQALKAFRSDKDSGPFKFVILGGAPKQLRKISQYLEVEFQDWRSCVELVGWTSRVQDYMAAADLMFYPSYFEAFSLVEIEAAAMGLPMILTRHHGSEMILDEGVNGYFCESTNKSICNALNRFRERPLVVKEPNIGKALTVGEWAQLMSKVVREIKTTKNRLNEG